MTEAIRLRVEDIMAECRNYFEEEYSRHFGWFEIVNGEIKPVESFLVPGQWFRVVGSKFNDGVYQYPAFTMVDERFDGSVWALAVPPAVVACAEETVNWEKREAHEASAMISESFGGYTYTKAVNSKGQPVGWRDVYAERLKRWRKMP